MDSAKIEARKETAKAWFEALRDRLLAVLEDLERALPAGAPLSECAAGSPGPPGSAPTIAVRRVAAA
jgi:hypothetical protein